MAFVKKNIDITFTLGTGQFGTGGGNQKTLKGFRTSVKVLKAGPPAMSTMQLAVYGMTKDDMNALSTLGMVIILARRNTVLVEAYEDGQTPCKIFEGTIINGYVDAQGAPDTVFRVDGGAGVFESVQTAPPSSYPGPTDVAVIMKSLADLMHLNFEPNGVSVQLSSPSYVGSPRDQAAKAAKDAHIEWVIDNGVLAIWKKGKARPASSVPLISATTGMVGYPTYTSSGIRVQTLFNPAVIFGSQIQVKSILPQANNTWNIYRIDHDLEAQVPGGRWFSTIDCFNPTGPEPIALG